MNIIVSIILVGLEKDLAGLLIIARIDYIDFKISQNFSMIMSFSKVHKQYFNFCVFYFYLLLKELKVTCLKYDIYLFEKKKDVPMFRRTFRHVF